MDRRRFLHTAASLPLLAQAMPQARAQTAPPLAAGLNTAPRFGDSRDWWFQKRFGMFVHWGLYAIHGLHEQEQWRNRVPRSACSSSAVCAMS